MKTKNPQNITESSNKNVSKTTYSIIKPLVKTQLFGVGVTNETEKNILEYIINFIEKTQKNLFIVTPNPEMIVFAKENPKFKDVLNEADLALCDGAGLFKSAQIMGKPLKERIIGTNFVERLCEKVIDWPITVGFLGGQPRVAEKAAECLAASYPGLKVSFAGANPEDLLSLPTSKMPNILFVAFGVPKQEFWMAENYKKLPIRVMMGVGGAFDQIVDKSLRPPALIHKVGFGWLYRLVKEPWRFKRQLKLIPFIFLTLKEKLVK